MSQQNIDNAVEMNLRVLEDQRQIIISQIKLNCIKFIAFPILILGGVIFVFKEKFLLLNKEFDEFPLYALLFLVFAIALAGIVYFYTKGKQKFEAIYKDTLVKPLMEKLYPNLQYSPKEYVDEMHFQNSNLFYQGYTNYGGDDFFSGEIENVHVEFSELKVIKSSRNEDGSNSNKNNSTIFSGLFLHTKLEKAVPGQIILDPMLLYLEKMQLPGFILGLIKSVLPNYGKVVKTGNVEFDDNFKLHCENEEVATEVMNPKFTQKILEIAGKLKEINSTRLKKGVDPASILSHGVFLKLSIVNDSLYFAIFGNKFFDVNFKKSTLESKQSIILSVAYINMLVDIAKSV